MATPLELVIITDPAFQYSNHQSLLSKIRQQLPGIVSQQISLPKASQTFNLSRRKDRVFLVLTHAFKQSNPLHFQQFLSKIDTMGGGIILFPVRVIDNTRYRYAQTIEEICQHLKDIQRRNQFSGNDGMDFQKVGTGNDNLLSPRSAKSNIPFPSHNILPPQPIQNLQSQPRLTINYYTSPNKVYLNDMNNLFLQFQNNPRVKFNQIKHLTQIPNLSRRIDNIQQVDNLLFVSDTQMQQYINQYEMVNQGQQGGHLNFMPILYNTSLSDIPITRHFQMAIFNYQRARAEVATYLNNIGYQSYSHSSIPAAGLHTTVINSHSNINTGPHLHSNTNISNAHIPPSHTRLIVLDPKSSNPSFTNFYRSLPIDYKLIPYLKQNSVFQYPTILLAPIESYEHVISRILFVEPDINNLKCIFYDASMVNSSSTSNNLKYVRLVTGNTREIEGYLRASNVLFVNGMVESRMRVENASTSAFAGMNGVIRYAAEWNVKKRPGERQRHVTYEAKDEELFLSNQLHHFNSKSRMQQRQVSIVPFPSTLPSPSFPQTHSTTLINNQQKISNTQQFQILPNQSQMFIGQSHLNLPKNSITQQKQIVTKTTTITKPPPIQHTSKVIQEVFEETSIRATNKNKSNIHSNIHSNINLEENNQSITINQIHSIPVIEVSPPPLSGVRQETFQMTQRVEPLIIPPQPKYIPPPPLITKQFNQVIAPIVRQNIIQNTIIQPVAQKIQVPSITNGYYSSTTTTTAPAIITTPTVIPTLSHSRSASNFNSATIAYPTETKHVTTYSPAHHTQTITQHRSVSPSVNVSRKVIESQRIDPLKYEKTIKNGKVTYVMREEYKAQLINDAVGGRNTIGYDGDYNTYKRKSRVTYDTHVLPGYNEIEYVVDTNPKIRRSRVIEIIDETPTITNRVHGGGMQIFQKSINHHAVHSYSPVRSYSPSNHIQTFDPLKFQQRIQNGVKVYYRRSSVSPLSRSNVFIQQLPHHHNVQINKTNIYPSHSPIIITQPLRRSIVIEDSPRRTSRVIIQNSLNIPEIIEHRRSRVNIHGSNVYNNRYQNVHLIFKKLNSMFVSLSQLFRDSNYRIHKYHSFNELAAILRDIPYGDAVVLMLDDVSDFNGNQFGSHHVNMHVIVVPKSNRVSRYDDFNTKKMKHKCKYIFQDTPERVYYQLMNYMNQFVYNKPTHSTQKITNIPHYVSPPHYNIKNNNNYIISQHSHHLKPSLVSQNLNNFRKIIIYPANKSQIKDYFSYRFPGTFDYISYYDLKSLTKELDYWPGNNLIVILGEQMSQQIGVVMRLSRNAEYIVYDPDNRGYEKQDYNAVKRIRDMDELGREIEELVGGRGAGSRGRSFY